MGLDIYVVKPIEPTKKLINQVLKDKSLPNGLEDYSITDNPELERWKHLSFKKQVEYIDFKKSFEQFGLKEEDYEWRMTGGNGYYFDKKYKSSIISLTALVDDEFGYDLCIPWEKLITFFKEEDIIIGQEVGWQRKGANSLFYQKNENGNSMWDSPPVVDRNILNEHWHKYFSCSTPQYEGGFGYGVEFEQSDSEMKDNFEKNIINKFVEGDTFVIYA
jgi:hypothetical protein